VIQADVKPSQASPGPLRDAGATDALAAVVESATAVARAELRLMKAEAKAWLTRAAVSLGLLWLSLLLLQVFVLVLALTPVLAHGHPWQTWGLMLLLALLPTATAGGLALRGLKRLKEFGNEGNADRDQ
jgi:drug/metabolite transporter (DMT)-like permease